MPGKPITKPVRCDCCKKDEKEMFPEGLENLLFAEKK
jgi:hypothetical protein